MDTTHDDSLEPRADAPGQPPGPVPAPPEPAIPQPPAPEPSFGTPAPLPAPPQPAPRAPWGALLVVTALVSALVGGAAGVGAPLLAERLRPDAGTDDGAGQTAPVEPVAAAAARAVPSVVNIDITGDAESSDALPPDHPGIPIVGSGSGVAYRTTDDGGTYIVTNHHVIEKATEIVVTDSTGERYNATLVGQDPNTDIAVVRVDAVLPTIALGDSETLEVGDLVIAIGAPFGLSHSVTAGVISAEHRSLTDNTTSPGVNPLVDVIQTDAAINPGNSGGALVNRAGELVGVPTAIYSGSGTNANIGFAVTVRTVVRVADQIIDLGYVEHPFLGVQGRTVTPDFAEQEELPVEEGVYIVSTIPGTEAEKSGITEGDVIVAIDSARIRTMEELLLSVRRRLVGDELTVTLYRDGERLEVPMTVGAKPDDVD